MYKLFNIWMLLLLLHSCKKDDDPIIEFCDNLQKTLNRSELIEFKNTPKDSLFHGKKVIENKFLILYHDSLQEIKLNTYFDKIDPTLRNGAGFEFKRNYLYLAFHSKLNGIVLDYDEIFKECQKQWNIVIAEFDKKDAIFEIQRHQLMLENNKRCKIGDIISLSLGVEDSSTGFYKAYPLSLNYSKIYDDSLQIRGKLISKRVLMSFDNKDTTEIVFKFKIIKLSNPNYKIEWEKRKVGDSFKLPIGLYGRMMQKSR